MSSVPEILPNPLAQVRASFLRWDAPRPLGLWHLASFDASTVAVVWTMQFAWAASVRLPVWVPMLLALIAWAAYVGDRLLDARAVLLRGATLRLRRRHFFHWRYRRILIPMALAAACVATGIVLFLMPLGARARNSVLAAATMLYFTRVHSTRRPPLLSGILSPHLPKELLVGLLFTAACVLPVFSRVAEQPGVGLWPLAAAAVFFALLAWLNCHAIDRWESRETPHRALQVFVSACVLAMAGLALAISLAGLQPRFAALVAAGVASALCLALLDRLRPRLTPLALRVAADLVLLCPALLTPLAWLAR